MRALCCRCRRGARTLWSSRQSSSRECHFFACLPSSQAHLDEDCSTIGGSEPSVDVDASELSRTSVAEVQACVRQAVQNQTLGAKFQL